MTVCLIGALKVTITLNAITSFMFIIYITCPLMGKKSVKRRVVWEIVIGLLFKATKKIKF